MVLRRLDRGETGLPERAGSGSGSSLTRVYSGNIHDQVKRYRPSGKDVGLEKLSECTGFEWDEGNWDKNWIRHRVSRPECEQVFFNAPLVVGDDPKHSQQEDRYFGLGQTDAGRELFVVFTVRSRTIRVISARDMNRTERRIYHEKENPEIPE
jgi:hypothetical protein